MFCCFGNKKEILKDSKNQQSQDDIKAIKIFNESGREIQRLDFKKDFKRVPTREEDYA